MIEKVESVKKSYLNQLPILIFHPGTVDKLIIKN